MPFIWFLTITWLSTKGGISLPGFSLVGTDKLAHAGAYGLLSWLVLKAYGTASMKLYWLVGGFAFLYGALMEWVQFTWFPNRFFEVDDMLANGIGAAGGVLFFHYVSRK